MSLFGCGHKRRPVIMLRQFMQYWRAFMSPMVLPSCLSKGGDRIFHVRNDLSVAVHTKARPKTKQAKNRGGVGEKSLPLFTESELEDHFPLFAKRHPQGHLPLLI